LNIGCPAHLGKKGDAKKQMSKMMEDAVVKKSPPLPTPAATCHKNRLFRSLGAVPCYDHASIAVLHCGAFLLWRLPDASACPDAYCATPSGLFGE
jgi:hypothetical protein